MVVLQQKSIAVLSFHIRVWTFNFPLCFNVKQYLNGNGKKEAIKSYNYSILSIQLFLKLNSYCFDFDRMFRVCNVVLINDVHELGHGSLLDSAVNCRFYYYSQILMKNEFDPFIIFKIG